jgi:hypothetical protein
MVGQGVKCGRQTGTVESEFERHTVLEAEFYKG